MKAMLKKIKSSHNNLQDSYIGEFDSYPAIGKSFYMDTTEGGVITTHVTAYTRNFQDNSIGFKTRNSEYLLILGLPKAVQ